MSYGTTTALSAGTATLARPAPAKWLMIQNQDVTPLLVTFKSGANTIGQVSLSAASAQGSPGGYIDSLGFPVFLDADSVVLTSTTTAGQVGSAQSLSLPNNMYGGFKPL